MCPRITMEAAEQWQFVYLQTALGEDAEGQSAPLWAHLQLLVSSALWCLSPCQQQTSAFGVCALLCTGLGRARPHEEHLAGVLSWICCSPAVLASEDYFAAEYAAVRKSKGKFLLKAI